MILGVIGVIVAISLSFIFLRLAGGDKLEHIGTWILSANFAGAFFAINFAFIGYNLSPYSKLWRRLSWGHWILIFWLLLLPIIPIICLIIKPNLAIIIAVIISPWAIFLSAFTYYRTSELIDPRRVLAAEYTHQKIKNYCARLASTLTKDSEKQKAEQPLPTSEQPTHMWDYRTNVIEVKHEPLWDRLMIVFSVAVDAHDYEVFEIAFDKAVGIYKELLKHKSDDISDVSNGLQYIADRRFKSLLALVGKSPSDRIFMETINSRLCVELTSSECLHGFKERFPLSIMEMQSAICQEALVKRKDYDVLKAINAIHTFTGVAAAECRNDPKDVYAPFTVSHSIWIIKRIGSYAASGKNVEILYRCLDALSWLGCGIAVHSADPKHRMDKPLKACISSLVQLGREARHNQLQCFWESCILPPHIHAEEKLGWILKLLVQIPESGDYYLKDTITEAYSRLRGFECSIEPNPQTNPKFWIKDKKDENGKEIPHKCSMSGREGYDWEIDYSDESELKEYTLH